jgi:glycosyltransferase involved in cell wall biosynthesis
MPKIKKTDFLIITHPHLTLPGGAGKVILELGKVISKDIKIVVICQKINPEYIKSYPEIQFESLNGPITSSLKFWLLLPYWRRKTFRVIDKYRTRGNIAILSNVFPSNWITLPYKKKHREIKMFWYCHEPSAFIHIKKWRNAISNPIKRALANILSPLLALIDKKYISFADLIFANSEYTASNIMKIYGRKSIILYPGVDLMKFKPKKIQEKENYILTVGRLTKFKNVDTILEGFSNVRDKSLNLLIVGDGEEKENLSKLAAKLGISSRVKFLSNVNDNELPDIYAKAKVFILCSKEEPFGIVPIEAMASGTAVIADNSGGPMEIIENEKTGLLIDCSPGNIASAIEKVMANLPSLSTETRKSVDRFSWQKSAKTILHYLQ